MIIRCWQRLFFLLSLTGLAGIGLIWAAPAFAIEWSGVSAKEVTLFYPGQSSFEWTLTQSDHSGASKFREGKRCDECHRGEEAKIGDLIVSGKKLEPNPVPGKRGSIRAEVRTAHDSERLYFRIEWPDSPPLSGSRMDEEFEEKVTVMISDGTVVSAKRAGCWGSCHDDAIGMPSDPSDADLTKYLPRSRTQLSRQGGGQNYKSQSDLQALMGENQFLEFWQARLNKDAAAVPADGYILEKRHQSDSPAVSAEAEFADGKWTVVLSRPLSASRDGHINIAAGQTYYLGFAIHDNYAEHRFHHVTFGYTLILDSGSADFVAAGQ